LTVKIVVSPITCTREGAVFVVSLCGAVYCGSHSWFLIKEKMKRKKMRKREREKEGEEDEEGVKKRRGRGGAGVTARAFSSCFMIISCARRRSVEV